MKRRESMSKLKKLVVTIGALAALAVGGAAFAQAQNASTPVTAPTYQSVSEQTSPGDADSVQSSSRDGLDQAGETDARDSASEQNDAPDSVAESDSPDGPNESADGPDRESQDD
jgi:hypothetical protein